MSGRDREARGTMGAVIGRPAASVNIKDVPRKSGGSLIPILDQSFTGFYRWHAKRTLRSVRWVRQAVIGGRKVGLSMFTMPANHVGYVYYIAVSPQQRASGIGGALLDDSLAILKAAGAAEVLASVSAENTPSIRLLQSRDFARTSFGELARSKGLMIAVLLWMRMVVAPGEKVYIKAM